MKGLLLALNEKRVLEKSPVPSHSSIYLLVLKQIANAADGGDVRRDLRAHFGADASDVHVDGARAAAVLKAPHAVQQHLAAVGAVRVRRQKAQQRVLHQRQVDGLVIECHLVGSQVDLEVIDVEHIVGGNGLLLTHQALRASLELVGRRRGAYKVGMRVIGQTQGAKRLVVNDHQHGDAAAIVKPLGNLIDAVAADAIGIENQQVKVVRRSRRIGGCQAHLDTQGGRQAAGKLVEARRARHEQGTLFGHIGLQRNELNRTGTSQRD